MQGPSPALGAAGYKYSCLLLLSCISLISFFPLNVLLPAFPALAEQFNTSTTGIALAISLFTLVFAFSQFAAGPLSDKFGRKEILLGCLAISCLGSLGCTLNRPGSCRLSPLLADSSAGVFRLLRADQCDATDFHG